MVKGEWFRAIDGSWLRVNGSGFKVKNK